MWCEGLVYTKFIGSAPHMVKILKKDLSSWIIDQQYTIYYMYYVQNKFSRHDKIYFANIFFFTAARFRWNINLFDWIASIF